MSSSILSPKFDAIPEPLKEFPHWAGLRVKAKIGKNKLGKVPVNLRAGGCASHSDPSTWVPYAVAEQRCRNDETLDGLLFALSPNDPFTGIDHDQCVVDGRLSPEAEEMKQSLSSYFELSPSGTGIRGFVRASLPAGGNRRGRVEFYSHSRFLSVTGHHLEGTPHTIEHRQSELVVVHRKLILQGRHHLEPPAPDRRMIAASTPNYCIDEEDEAVLQTALSADRTGKLTALFRGEWRQHYRSQSEADMAFCSFLANWTQDLDQIDRLFRQSALYRPKWDEIHHSNGNTYGQETIARVLAARPAVVTPRRTSVTSTNPDLPSIIVTGQQSRDVVDAGLDALVRANNPPRLFVRGGALSRLPVDEEGRAGIVTLSKDAVRDLLARGADWFTLTQNGARRACPPPQWVVDGVSSQCEWPGIPPLQGIVMSPCVGQDGTLITEPGYHRGARLYYHAPQPLALGDITPTPERISWALEKLHNDAFGDFPFVKDGDAGASSSWAHTLCFILEPFVRPFISGATPIYAIDAPTPGTGKSLLVSAASGIFVPMGAPVKTAPYTEEEWSKALTSFLLAGGSHICLDNVRTLNSAELLAALTAYPTWDKRLLGGNTTVSLPVRVTWSATCNNLTANDELARRMVWIRLDAGVERPHERRGFRHQNLPAWIRENRAELVTAALVLVRAWLDAGRPVYTGIPLGSFEAWTGIMGGILATVGVPGFLANAANLRGTMDEETAAWTALVNRWYQTYGTSAVPSRVLQPLAEEYLEDPAARSISNIWSSIRWGKALAKRADRVNGGKKIVRIGIATSGDHKGSAEYRLELVDAGEIAGGNDDGAA